MWALWLLNIAKDVFKKIFTVLRNTSWFLTFHFNYLDVIQSFPVSSPDSVKQFNCSSLCFHGILYIHT